jgi:hypothetical protein
MTAFFTLIALGVSTMVPVAGGGVAPDGDVVLATATVTASVAEADGSIPTSWRSAREEKQVNCKRIMSA